MTEPIRLREDEREVALAEAQAVFARASESPYRDELAEVIAGLGAGEIAEAESEALEQLVEIGLQSGRIRALYGPGGEQAGLRLYRRLPRGAALGASAAEVSAALATLQGRRLDSIRVEAVGPGAFTIGVSVDGADLSIRLDRQGARVASVGT
jgi:hypothetical protein